MSSEEVKQIPLWAVLREGDIITRHEAKDILDAYEYRDEVTGEIRRLKYVLTAVKGELADKTAYGFITWSYSDNAPPDKAFALRCWIGDDRVIKFGNSPIEPIEHVIKLYNRHFPD